MPCLYDIRVFFHSLTMHNVLANMAPGNLARYSMLCCIQADFVLHVLFASLQLHVMSNGICNAMRQTQL